MFDTLLSNKKLKEQLSLAITQDKPLHAYMFCGAKGSGKKTAALQFASEIVGSGREKALRGAHPDIIFVRPEEDKRTISVDIIRNMRADAFISPTEGKRKVYIIDGALRDEGQNALLTILEQPPSFSVFILLTESKQQMLETVISRCSVYEMEYVEAEDGLTVLKQQLPSIDDERLLTCMRASSGNIGYALKLASDKTYLANIDVCKNIAIAMAKGDRYTALACLTFKKKEPLLELLPVLTVYLRDVLVYNTTKTTDMLVFSDDILKYGEIFGKIETERLYNSINECALAQAQLEASINLTLVSCSLATHLFGGIKL